MLHPTGITVSDGGRTVTIAFENGATISLSAARLRQETPSAEARSLSAADRAALVQGKDIRIVELETVGNYAMRPTFSDGHATGIYTWDALQDLAKGARAESRALKRCAGQRRFRAFAGGEGSKMPAREFTQTKGMSRIHGGRDGSSLGLRRRRPAIAPEAHDNSSR